ncbi:MAG: AraC family transcriptional regulator, partial [Lachnospiraceae bacterium]|nr:AraC family transcriptional regulator [Lachnospiraceae bacterium]
HSERCYTEYLNVFDRADSKITVPLNSDNVNYEALKKNAEALFEAAHSQTGEGDFLVKIKLLEIFRLVLESGVLETGHKYELASDPVRPAINYIINNYSEKITVEDLAKECHLSKSYFMNLFRKVTGTTVIGYLMQVRIDKACKLLANENMSASEAALSVGYTNISNFNRQFRELTGTTPKEYKKRK